MLPIGDELAVIVDPERCARPAVVSTRRQLVDLVPASRPMLVRPNRAGHGVPRQALRVAMPKRPDLWGVADPTDEGIVGRRLTVARQPQRLAQVACRVLRLVAIVVTVPDREQQRLVGQE